MPSPGARGMPRRMPMFGLRYDLRCPPFAEATSADLVEAAIEQCAWADERGFASVTLSEHHGAEDISSLGFIYNKRNAQRYWNCWMPIGNTT